DARRGASAERQVMKLGIPTLSRYDLLTKLLVSAECGTLKPDEYIIVDNGGQFVVPGGLRHKLRMIRPRTNLGVAASWNLLLDIALAEQQPIVISNDDIELWPETLAEM